MKFPSEIIQTLMSTVGNPVEIKPSSIPREGGSELLCSPIGRIQELDF